MQWRDSDNRDPKVVECSQWIILDNYENLECRSGVYVFGDINHQVKYIGKTGPGRMVDEIEDAMRRNKDYGAAKVKALYTNSDKNAWLLEIQLRQKYKPLNNLI